MIHIDLIYLSAISILAPTVLGAAIFKFLPKDLRIVAFLVFVTCLLEAVSFAASLAYINNLFLFHLFTYIEFACISYMYLSLFKRIRLIRYGIPILSATFVVLSIYFLLKKEYFDHYNSAQRGLEQLIILVYVLLFLYLFSKRLPEERHLLKPYFYLSIGWLIYFSGTFVIFLDAYGYLDLSRFLNWSVHSVLNIFLNAIYFAVFWMAGRMMRSKS